MDDILLNLLSAVEVSVSTLSGYLRGLATREEERDTTISVVDEKGVLFVAEDTQKSDFLTVNFEFTKKELTYMRENFKKEYTKNGLVLHVRRKGDVYEIRYRRDGLSLSASSKNLDDAKGKMHDLLCEAYALAKAPVAAPKKRKAVEYTLWYLDTVKRPAISAAHYKNLLGYLNRDLRPLFGERYLSEISYADLQAFLNGYVARGKFRTAQGVRTLLREIFKSALYDGEIRVDHAARLTPISYEQAHGRALPREEEQKAVQAILRSDSVHRNDFLIILFTGCRPCELSTIRYDGDFVVIDTAKQRKGKSKIRRVPMSPMFKRYVDPSCKPSNVAPDQLLRSLKLILPDVKTYDLRHTFITRAKECGVPEEVVMAWVGHSPLTLTGRTYTHFSDEYNQKMAQKLDY